MSDDLIALPAKKAKKSSVVDKIGSWFHSLFSTGKENFDENRSGVIRKSDSLDKRYDVIAKIGEGEFAKVAIKIITFDHQDQAEHTSKLIRTQQEIRIHSVQRLIHPNIVKLREFVSLPGRIAVVMDYISGGELFEYIQERGKLTEDHTTRFMSQLIDAVGYLHRMGIAHRDLKLENILVDDEDNLVLSDFGFSTPCRDPSPELLVTACGSPCYAAPEIVLDRTGYRGEPADIWSCGIIMYSMLFGHLPFENDLKLEMHGNDPKAAESITWSPTNVYQLYNFIRSKPLRIPKRTPISDEARSLLLGMLNVDPNKRFTMEMIQSHVWFHSSSNSEADEASELQG